MKTVVLMAFRGDGEGFGGSGWRDRAFTHIYDYLKPHFDLVVHDSGDEPFSISKSYNQAADRPWDRAIIHPPDVWVPLKQLRTAVRRANDRLIHPYDRIKKLSADQTEAFYAGQEEFRTRCYAGAFPPMVIPRWLWDEFGGFDETLVGHGSEDSIFMHCAAVFGEPPSRVRGPMYSMYHPKFDQAPNEREFYAHKAENRARLRRFWEITDPDTLRAFLR